MPAGRAWMEVDLEALRNNVRVIREETGARVMAIVKANGYGQGALPIARALEEGVSFFGTANLDEAVELSEGGIEKPVLILGPLSPGEMTEALRRGFRVTVFDEGVPETIARLKLPTGTPKRLHLKIDTGMSRLGIREEGLEQTLAELKRVEGVEIEGVFSHFASMGSGDRSFTLQQLCLFRDCLKVISRDLPPRENRSRPLFHMAASSAILSLPESYCDLVRPGLLMFGLGRDASGEKRPAWDERLKPALTLKARVSSVRKVPAGARVSYGGTFIAARESRIAVLPLGYADGYRRELSNRGEVLWHDRRFRVAGTVCMDMTMIDVTGHDVRPGDEVTLMTGEGADPLSPETMAGTCRTNVREIMIGTGSRRIKKNYLGR